jgi:hypothetical protein
VHAEIVHAPHVARRRASSALWSFGLNDIFKMSVILMAEVLFETTLVILLSGVTPVELEIIPNSMVYMVPFDS